MRALWRLTRRFGRDERGAFLVLFGVMAIVLVATAGAVVDYALIEQSRNRAQEALDGAALGLQPTLFTSPPPTAAQLKTKAQDLISERLADDTIDAVVLDAEFDADNTLTLRAEITVPTTFVALVGVGSIKASLVSQAKRGGRNVEVSVALDVTGSMQAATPTGTRISDLRAATSDLIDLVVQDADNQTPYYSRLALVPWAMGVNVDTYIAAIRGGVVAGTPITGAVWAEGAAKSITSIARNSSSSALAKVTSSGHGLSNGNQVYVTGTSISSLNNKVYTIGNVATNTFTLSGTSLSSSTTGSGGTATKCQFSACEVRVTSNSHGLSENEAVYIQGVGGTTQINNWTVQATQSFPATPPPPYWVAKSVTTNTFMLDGSTPGGTYTANTGTAYCASHRDPSAAGCPYLAYTTASTTQLSAWRSKQTISALSPKCVVERTGTHKYTDQPPSTAKFGRAYLQMYSTSGATGINDCPAQAMMPLTDDKVALHALAASLTEKGSTSGHIGTAWAWNLISPNFSYLWPEDKNKPAAYTDPNVLKIVILMTDGKYNTVHYQGMVANNAVQLMPGDTGPGNGVPYIDGGSLNGDSYAQAKALCDAMKTTSIVIYTVGFYISTDTNAQDVMSYCATDASHAYLATNGDELRAAFKAIGSNIASLRLSR